MRRFGVLVVMRRLGIFGNKALWCFGRHWVCFLCVFPFGLLFQSVIIFMVSYGVHCILFCFIYFSSLLFTRVCVGGERGAPGGRGEIGGKVSFRLCVLFSSYFSIASPLARLRLAFRSPLFCRFVYCSVSSLSFSLRCCVKRAYLPSLTSVFVQNRFPFLCFAY